MSYNAQIETARAILNSVSSQLFSILLIPVVFFSVCFYIIAISALFIRDQKKSQKIKIADNRLPKVTIQIPTMNDLVALRCAEACLKMDYPKNKVQIIIGDDSTKKDISKKIDSFAKKYKNIKVTRRGTNQGYKPGNLNHMLKYSNGEILFIFDSDFLPPKGFLKESVRPFLCDDKVACVQAKWGYLNSNKNNISKMSSFMLMFYHNLLAKINKRLDVSLLFGSAEGIRKDVLIKLGGWKEWSLTEDVEFSVRAIKNGYRVQYLNDIEVVGEVPFTLKDLAKQQKRWAFGNTKAFIQNAKFIVFNKKHNPLQKFFMSFTMLGYISSPLLLALLFLGFTMWFTGVPAPIDVVKFGSTSIRLIVATSGFFFAGFVALIKERRVNIAPSVLITSFTAGILVTLSVFEGLIRALKDDRMIWYAVNKEGNVGVNV
jgi:cellulose synthase/poly-beta-1,6-N-acetylglucosamine synthase-like glycosyltransferase